MIRNPFQPVPGAQSEARNPRGEAALEKGRAGVEDADKRVAAQARGLRALLFRSAHRATK
jgi:hypothetical protein